ncbi:synaptonemal complex protein 2-like [Brachyhypopomus gauderio]|uniref:synaptonemal complex protein 2-like n=1 Tax=Brachyhypopomus gauderio TaxID=698409 RepID=UPI00404158F8
MMNLSSRLEDAFASNDVKSAVMVIIEEKYSASLVDRLDEVAIRELHKNEFKNVILMLQAIEQLISSDIDCINCLVHQGIVIKMLNWFERVSDYLKSQPGPTKSPVLLMEVFYEVSMGLCQCNVEGSNKILEVLLLRFGAVVIDKDVTFSLRLEAIKTINSMLDHASIETRRKLCQTYDHNFLLEELAKVIIDVGDYEMQVAVSEALCRLTPKKQRAELVGKWFSYRSFATDFATIRVKEFETDCRIFLNKLNSYFGPSRSVYSFPCTRAFLDFTELFKPEDELVQQFWVDFNVGTSSISFHVNNPERELWELIHLPKERLSTYSLQESDDWKILSIHMSLPVTHGAVIGNMVQITFDSQHDIQTAVKRVFVGEKSPETPKHMTPLGEDSGLSDTTPADSVHTSTSSPAAVTKGRNKVSFVLQSGPGKLPSPKCRSAPVEDPFCLRKDSDTEVTMSETLNNTFLTDVSGSSHDRKPKAITFMAALWRYQVVRAKAVIFVQSLSSDGSGSSIRSIPAGVGQVKSARKKKLRVFHSESDTYVLPGERRLSRDAPHSDYTRKKPRLKSKLKVLPLSSPSSMEEECFKESTPKRRALQKRPEDVAGQNDGKEAELQSLDHSHPVRETTTDSGFQDKTVSENATFADEEPDVFTEKHGLSKGPPPRKAPLESTELCVGPETTEMQPEGEKRSPFSTLKPRRLFPSTSMENATETMSQALIEDEESETELGSGVMDAFNTFKTQLRQHFSSRYKKIEAKSLKSLTDCQNHVSSLLQTVHDQRLVQLDNFQDTVVQQLGYLEQNCLSLKHIEQETMRFWQSESDRVRSFCDRQQKRVDSVEVPKETKPIPQSQAESTRGMSSSSSDLHTTISMEIPSSKDRVESQ